jgi:enoyl-CoA hydratase/carnithine racemase
MPVTGNFDDYKDAYPHIRFERHDGILQMRLHSEGRELVWGAAPHHDLSYVFADVAADAENKVIIITGTGATFIDREDTGPAAINPRRWASTHRHGTKMLLDHLAVEAPIIAAVNGPATIHAELAVMADIVLASDTAVFQDKPHFPNGVVPGDGVHVIWPLLLGFNRGRYFLLTGQRLSAADALDLGVVSEVLAPDRLLDRAWALARELITQPPLTVRFFRAATLQRLRRAMLDDLPYGLALEGLAGVDFWPGAERLRGE